MTCAIVRKCGRIVSDNGREANVTDKGTKWGTSLALVEFATDALMECPATSGARLTFEGDVAALRIRSRRLRIDLTPTCYLLHEDALTPEGWCSNYWADHHHNAADALDAVHYWAERVHHDLAGNCL